jgi:glycerol kinase
VAVDKEMKSFKEYITEGYPKSYEKNPILKKLADKHDDPFKFVLDVITHMSAGKLKLRRIGVANTREVVAFWNDRKKKKINPALVEEYVMNMVKNDPNKTEQDY